MGTENHTTIEGEDDRPMQLGMPENQAQTLARKLPLPVVLDAIATKVGDSVDAIHRVALPAGWKLVEIDDEKLLENPRRTKFSAAFADVDSFIGYVNHHADGEHSALWCDYDPVAGRLAFTAVLDDNAAGTPGWRQHKAVFAPKRSHEWETWTKSHKVAMDQLTFATFLQDNERDITAKEGYPTSLQMHQLAQDFRFRSELIAKSAVRLQDGTTKLEYADQPDQPTQAQLKMFELFCIGIPVFAGQRLGDEPEKAYRIDARLRLKPPTNGKLAFWYELVRPDIAFETAARDIIKRIGEGLENGVRSYMGAAAA